MYSDCNVELNDTQLVVVFNSSKLTHVFGSKVLVLVLVCYKLTLTPPSKQSSSPKKRGVDKIKSTGNGKRLPRRSMAILLLVNG
jgi:hypothetical protein